MSKNDTMAFSISLINPGDTPLTGFAADFIAYRLEGTNQVTITNVVGTANLPADFSIDAGQTRSVELDLAAAADAPDNLVAEFTLRSAEGAAARFRGQVTLLPAVPVLTVVEPTVGYLEVSLDRGHLLSRPITVVNRGLKDLQGVELVPPTNVAWMAMNLPVSPDGRIRLPDINVGQSNTFTVVFAPPAETTLDYYHDRLVIRGTNALATFPVDLYALVTSDQKGAVQFYVENILGQAVSNATVRLRNTLLQVELPPVLTDAAGLVTVGGLQEGNWSWQVTAPGHSGAVGTVNIIPSQTVQVGPPATRLSKSLVTITFQVVPVPYTDRYEIKIEQTFETHVPAPVLVLDPAYREFKDVTPGFEANFVATVKNHGLIEMTDVQIIGQDDGRNALTPLITYLPRLLPEETVEIPFRYTYGSTTGQQGQVRQDDAIDCLAGALPSSMAGFINPDVAAGIAAIVRGDYRCYSDASTLSTEASLMAVAGLALAADVFTSSQDFIGAFVGSLASCLLGNFVIPAIGGTTITGPGPRSDTAPFIDVERLQCFAAGTPVTLDDGTRRPIEAIQRGDRVRTGSRPTRS